MTGSPSRRTSLLAVCGIRTPARPRGRRRPAPRRDRGTCCRHGRRRPARRRPPSPARRPARRPAGPWRSCRRSAERRSASMVEADASVWPAPSSTTWTKMCLADRVTTRRGRSAVPETFLRTRDLTAQPRRRTRSRCACAASARSPWSLTSLSDLAADVLARVAHALALVGLGLAQLADVGGDLADLLLVDARRPSRVGLSTAKVMPSGALNDDRVAEAELRTRAGSGPWTGRGSRRPRSRASSRSRRSRRRPCWRPACGSGRAGTGCSARRRGGLTSRTPSSPFSTAIGAATVCVRVPLGPLTVTTGTVDGDVDAGGDRDRKLADARHCCSPPVSRHQT